MTGKNEYSLYDKKLYQYSCKAQQYLNDTTEYGLQSDRYKEKINIKDWYSYLASYGYEKMQQDEYTEKNGEQVFRRLKALLRDIGINTPTFTEINDEETRNDVIKFYSFLVKFVLVVDIAREAVRSMWIRFQECRKSKTISDNQKTPICLTFRIEVDV